LADSGLLRFQERPVWTHKTGIADNHSPKQVDESNSNKEHIVFVCFFFGLSLLGGLGLEERQSTRPTACNTKLVIRSINERIDCRSTLVL